MKSSLAVTASALIALTACAEQAKNVEAQYVSPNVYQGRNCGQLLSERNEIVRKVNELARKQDQAATNDAVATGVALLVFWPAAIALAATNDRSEALSAAKGNFDAITQRMKQQRCKIPEPIAPSGPDKKT